MTYPQLVTETYHSRIEKVLVNDVIAVRKTARRITDQTKAQWKIETGVMKRVREDETAPRDIIVMILNSDPEYLSITMSYEPGQSLDQHISSNQMCTLDLESVNLLWLQMSKALAFLHSQSIIHDDIKPDNILWIPDDTAGRAVLIDFGAAIIVQPGKPVVFNYSGTPPYAPPEFLDKQKEFVGDIWALGVTMLFARGEIKLPDGSWILPHVFEKPEPLQQMRAWLSSIQALRDGYREIDIELAGMLEMKPEERILAKDLANSLAQRFRSDL